MNRWNHQSTISYPPSSPAAQAMPRVKGELQYLEHESAVHLRLEGHLTSLHVVYYVRKAFDAILQYPTRQLVVDLRNCDSFPDSGRFWALLHILKQKDLRRVLSALKEVVVVREAAKHRVIDDLLGPIFYRLTRTQIIETPDHPYAGLVGKVLL